MRPTRHPRRQQNRPVYFRAPSQDRFGAKIYAAVDWTSSTSLGASAHNAVEAHGLWFRSRSSMGIATTITGEKVSAYVVGMDGTRYAELVDARVGSITWSLNSLHSVSLTMPATSPQAAAVTEIEREIQVWKGDALLFWGPIVKTQADEGTLTVQAFDPRWYLARRHFGKAERQDYVTNGSFENGKAGWTMVRTAISTDGLGNYFYPWFTSYDPNVAHTTPQVDNAKDGTHVLRITNNEAGSIVDDVWEVGYDLAIQAIEIEAPSNRSIEVTATGWQKVTSLGEPDETTGLSLALVTMPEGWPSPSTSTWWPTWAADLYGTWDDISATRFDPDVPRDVWVRHEVALIIPAGETKSVVVLLHNPKGVTEWDKVRLTIDEGIFYDSTDARTVIEGWVDHAQDATYGKTDVQVGVSGGATGKKIDADAYFHDHEQIWGKIVGLSSADDGVEVGLDLTPTARNVSVHYPYAGTNWGDRATLEWGRDFQAFRRSFDGDAAGNQVVVLWTGEGSDREETATEDLTAFGGISIEKVVVVPDGTPVEDLDEYAAEVLRVSKDPDTLEIWATENVEIGANSGYGTPVGAVRRLLGTYAVGDRLKVRIPRTVPSIADVVYRIVSITFDPETAQVSAVLNRWTVEE